MSKAKKIEVSNTNKNVVYLFANLCQKRENKQTKNKTSKCIETL